jgi:hypothetical protein
MLYYANNPTGKSCVEGGISEGIVSPRQASADLRPMPEMAKAAASARAKLHAIQMKALLMPPPVRMQGWDSLHGKAIPNMQID